MIYCMFSIFLGKGKKKKKAHIDVLMNLWWMKVRGILTVKEKMTACDQRCMFPRELLWCHRTVPHVLQWSSAGDGEALPCHVFQQRVYAAWPLPLPGVPKDKAKHLSQLMDSHDAPKHPATKWDDIWRSSPETLGHRLQRCRGSSRRCLLHSLSRQRGQSKPQTFCSRGTTRLDGGAQALPALPPPAARWRRGAAVVPRASGGHGAARPGLLLPSWAPPESLGGGGRHLVSAAGQLPFLVDFWRKLRASAGR